MASRSKVRGAWGLDAAPDGYDFTPVPPEFWTLMERARCPPVERLVLLSLLRLWRFEDGTAPFAVGLPELARMTGFSEPHLSRALGSMDKRFLDQTCPPGRKRQVSIRRLLHHVQRVARERNP